MISRDLTSPRDVISSNYHNFTFVKYYGTNFNHFCSYFLVRSLINYKSINIITYNL